MFWMIVLLIFAIYLFRRGIAQILYAVVVLALFGVMFAMMLIDKYWKRLMGKEW